MSVDNPRGHSVSDTDFVRRVKIPGVYTFATLPRPVDPTATGILAYTSDQGMCAWNGTIWVANGGGTAAGPSNTPGFGASVLSPAALATSQNDYSPASWAITVSKLRLTPASGGSTVTGIAALTFADGATVQLFNISTTDSIIFPNASGSSATANQFLCPSGSSVTLAPNAGTYITRDGGKWRFS